MFGDLALKLLANSRMFGDLALKLLANSRMFGDLALKLLANSRMFGDLALKLLANSRMFGDLALDHCDCCFVACFVADQIAPKRCSNLAPKHFMEFRLDRF